MGSGSSTLGLANLQVYSNSFNNVSPTSCLQSTLSNAFGNISNISQAVNTLMTSTFNICVTAWNPSTGLIYGPTKCTTLTFFSQNGNNLGSAPIIIVPHNNGICGLPRFVWTQAVYQGQIATTIPYILKVCKGSQDGTPVETINIPAGQCYYQWSAKDPVLLPNVKYFFTIIAIGPTGSPLFATSKVWKWFIVNCIGSTSLKDVDAIVKGYFNGAGAKSNVAPIVQKLTIKGVVGSDGLNNPVFAQIQNGTAKINNITLVH